VTRVTEVPALSPASFSAYLAELPAETRGDYVATEHGRPWARVSVGPYGSLSLAVFPVGAAGERGDTRKRGQAGVVLSLTSSSSARRDAALLVIGRARRMYLVSVAS
jgi:hypothetical protein